MNSGLYDDIVKPAPKSGGLYDDIIAKPKPDPMAAVKRVFGMKPQTIPKPASAAYAPKQEALSEVLKRRQKEKAEGEKYLFEERTRKATESRLAADKRIEATDRLGYDPESANPPGTPLKKQVPTSQGHAERIVGASLDEKTAIVREGVESLMAEGAIGAATGGLGKVVGAIARLGKGARSIDEAMAPIVTTGRAKPRIRVRADGRDVAVPVTQPKPIPQADDLTATGLNMAQRKAEAAAKGTPEPQPAKTGPLAQHHADGKRAVETGEIDPEELLGKLAGDDKRAATPKEYGAILEGRRRLLNDLNRARAELDALPGDPELISAYEKVNQRIEGFDSSLDVVKGESGASLNALKIGTTLDTGDFAQVIQEAKRLKPLAGADEATYQKMTGQIAQRDAKIAQLESDLAEQQAGGLVVRGKKAATTFDKEAVHAEIESLFEEFKSLKPAAGVKGRQSGAVSLTGEDLKMAAKRAELVGRLAISYGKLGIANLEEVVVAVQGAVRDRLGIEIDRQEIIDAMAPKAGRTRSEIEKELSSLRAQAKRESTAGKASVQAKIDELKGQLDSGVYRVPQKRELTISKELETLRAERDVWDAKVRSALAERAKSTNRRIAEGAAGLIRGSQLGSDIGTLFRQGLFGLGHPVEFAKSIAAASKTIFSDTNYAKWNRRLQEREIEGAKMIVERRKGGLRLSDKDIAPEEMGVGKWLSKMPLVGGALNRAQHTFINNFRAEVFDASWVKGLRGTDLKRRGEFINNVSGRGNVKNIPWQARALFTSPDYEMSRWATLGEIVRNPVRLGVDLVTGKGINKGAAENVKTLAKTAGSLYTLAKAAETQGYVVDWDPRSSDFLKMRKYEGGDVEWSWAGPRYIGGTATNEVWDVSAGLAPRARDLFRVVFAMGGPEFGKSIQDTAGKAVGRAVSPAAKLPVEQGSYAYQRFVEGKDPSKIKSPISGFVPDDEEQGWLTLAPLIWKSFFKASGEDGYSAGAWAWLREFVGTSVQRYPKK